MPRRVVSAPAIESPECLRAFEFHGLEFSGHGVEVVAECPFCGAEKFYVDSGTGRWDCKKGCGSGNVFDFVRELHSQSMKMTKDYSWIESHRGLSKDALRAWGVCQSISTRDWIVPGYLVNGNIGNLNRYIRTRKEDGSEKYILYPTPTLIQCYFTAIKSFDHKKPNTDIAEGPWDGMALWDALRTTKVDDSGEYIHTSNESLSLLSTRNVIAVPGANTFHEGWSKLTAEKNVTFLYDNDHPKTNPENNHVTRPGLDGMRRASEIISTVIDAEKPKSISYLDWSGKGGDDPAGYIESRKDGFDIRDLLKEEGNEEGLKSLFGMLRPIPAKWVEGKGLRRGSGEAKPIEAVDCKSWKVLCSAWKKAMKWGPGLEGGLAVCLASIASVKSQGTKLWVQLLSPPSTGKTMICDALAAAKKYCIAESDMTSFYSGWAPDGKESKDASLANRLWDKTLITKEGDTILKSKSLDTIFSQGRELFDGTGGKSFANDVKRDYEGLIFTWILAGTSSLRLMDTSELGQRFIRYTIMDEIPEDLEDEITTRAAFQQLRNSKVESNCKLESTMDEDYLRATRLTIGYIHHLKMCANEAVNNIEITDEQVMKCTRYAKFVAYLRARPSKTQEENTDRELGARLTKQFVKLMQFLTVVLGKKKVDDAVMKLVYKVTMDSAYGRTLKIVTALAECGNEGLDLKGVGNVTGQTAYKESHYLTFLTRIKACEQFTVDIPSVAAGSYARWRLTDNFRKLYRDVMKGVKS